MTLAEAKKHLKQIERGPATIARAVKGLDRKTLSYKPAPNKWSIMEILGHLADMEIVLGHRLRQALADEKPVVSPIDQDAWAAHLHYLEATPEEHLEAFMAARRANLRLLRLIQEEDLPRGAFHPELNRLHTVQEVIERMLRHDPNHLGQIERIKKLAGKS